MSFAAPWALLLLGAIAAVVVVDAARPWRSGPALKVAAVAVRSLMLALLAIALSGPALPILAPPPTFVFVLDRSDSIDDAQLADGAARLQELAQQAPSQARKVLLLVDGEVQVAREPSTEPLTVPVPPRSPSAGATDLASGIAAALALIDRSGSGRIVVASDGANTEGAVARAAQAARDAGVPIDGLVLPAPPVGPELRDVSLSRRVVRPGETLEGRATVRGGYGAGRAVLRLAIDGEPAGELRVDLPADGLQSMPFNLPIPPAAAAGPRRLTATLSLADGSTSQRALGMSVAPPPTVLLVTDTPREMVSLSAVLSAQGMRLVERSSSEAKPEDLPQVDLVVLGDVPAMVTPGEPRALTTGFIAALRRYVSSGGGLLTLGGDRTYDLGGWGSTPLAQMVPLDLSPQADDVEPAASVVHILDNSASMGDWTGHQRKMALANEAAVASIRLLRDKDQIEVMAVNTEVARVVALQPATDPARVAAAVRSIRPRGGGIYVYTALVETERALAGATTPLKHVMLYSDAQDAEEKVQGIPMGWGPGPNAFQVASRLRSQGVTLSVIALGDPRDQDVPFLRQLAEVGGGRFAITSEAEELRALYVEETRQVIRSVIHDRAFRVRPGVQHPSVAGVDIAGAPPLRGYVEVQARPTATVVLEGPDDVPVLATWQYGLGQVGSLSVDLGSRWARGWLDWDDYPRFVAQLARWAVRPPVARGVAIETVEDPDGLRVVIQHLGADGLAVGDGGLSAARIQADTLAPLDLRPLEPGLWSAPVPAAPGEPVEIVVSDATGEIGRQTVLAPDATEGRERSGDALATLAADGGVLDPDVLGPAGARGPRRSAPLAGWLALLAALLLPVDAWLRRAARR